MQVPYNNPCSHCSLEPGSTILKVDRIGWRRDATQDTQEMHSLLRPSPGQPPFSWPYRMQAMN